MDGFNGTPEQMKKAEFMIAAANTCKDYLQTLQRANKNCMNMANKYLMNQYLMIMRYI